MQDPSLQLALAEASQALSDIEARLDSLRRQTRLLRGEKYEDAIALAAVIDEQRRSLEKRMFELVDYLKTPGGLVTAEFKTTALV